MLFRIISPGLRQKKNQLRIKLLPTGAPAGWPAVQFKDRSIISECVESTHSFVSGRCRRTQKSKVGVCTHDAAALTFVLVGTF